MVRQHLDFDVAGFRQVFFEDQAFVTEGVGGFAACFVEPVRARVVTPCELLTGDERELLARLGDVEVVVTLAFTPAMGAAASRVRLVQVPGAGVDRIDRGALPPGAMVANAYGHERGIAEYVLGAMLAWNHRFVSVDAHLRRGRWDAAWSQDAPPPPFVPELGGKTLGILGYGRIGQAVARRARAFDMAVHAIRREPRGTSAEGLASLAGPDGLPALLDAADYLAITLALTPETRGMIGARELAPELIDETLGVVLKYEEDIRQVRGDATRRYLAEAAAGS